MLDGFRYLEERDASDKITRAGVVSKKSAFVLPDNAGIYDAIALDLRLLAEAATSLADDANLQQILTQVKDMYDDMRTNPNFGSTAARAAAEDALKQAQAAATSAASAKEYGDKAASVAAAITAVENYLKTIDALEKSTSDNATVATNKAQAAATSETNAATSATAAKASETNAASSASSASKSADSAKAWAVSTSSPDGVSDSDSPTGKTQSARTWALAAKSDAKAVAANTKTTADNTAKAQAIVDNATKSIQATASGEWNITAAKAKTDADGNTIGTTYLKRSGGTMTGVLNFANNVWNAVGDDAAIGDHSRAGHICIKGLNAPTGLAMYKQGSDSDGDAAHIVYNGSTINIDKRLTGLAAQFYIDADGYLAYRNAL